MKPSMIAKRAFSVFDPVLVEQGVFLTLACLMIEFGDRH